MTTFYFYMDDITNITTKVSTLNTKLSLDLDLSAKYISTVFNSTTQNVEITFNATLTYLQDCVMDNITKIILYNDTTSLDVYYVNPNFINRASYAVTTAPSTNNDIISGYAVGSIATTTTNDIYTCTDNTQNNAVWTKIYPQAASGPTGQIGPTGSTGQIGPTGSAGTSINAQDYAFINRTNTTATTITPGGATISNLATISPGSNWTTNGTTTLTTPNTGVYAFTYNATVVWTGSATVGFVMRINGTNYQPSAVNVTQPTSHQMTISQSYLVSLTAGNTITFFMQASSNNVTALVINTAGLNGIGTIPNFTIIITRVA